MITKEELLAQFPKARVADETDGSLSFYLGPQGWYFTLTDEGIHCRVELRHQPLGDVQDDPVCTQETVLDEVADIIQGYINEWQGDIDRLQAKVNELQDCI